MKWNTIQFIRTSHAYLAGKPMRANDEAIPTPPMILASELAHEMPAARQMNICELSHDHA